MPAKIVALASVFILLLSSSAHADNAPVATGPAVSTPAALAPTTAAPTTAVPSARVPAASLVGARPLDQGASGWWAAVGVPDVEVGVRVGQNSLSDIGGRLRLSWGTGATIGGFGVSANFLSRLRFARLEGWDLALTAEPGVFVHGGVEHWAPLEKANITRTSTLMGIDCGVPGVQASTWLTPGVHLAVGLAAPIRVHVSPEPTLEVPVLLQLASEFVVGDGFSAVAMGEVGTAFYGPGAGSPTADLTYRLRLGVGWR